MQLNYLKEINAFYDWLETNTVTDSAIVLWHALMHVSNRAGWPDEFAVAISTLSTKTGLKKDAIIRARLRLQQLGRIDFNSRSGQQSATYKLISFESFIPTQSATQNDSVVLSDANRNTNREQTASQTALKVRHKPRLLLKETKLNETKQSNKKTLPPKGESDPEKIQYADYVSMTEEQYRKLTELLGEDERDRFFLEFASWISGKSPAERKRRDAYLTILNWHRREQKNPKPQQGQMSKGARQMQKFQEMMREAEERDRNRSGSADRDPFG